MPAVLLAALALAVQPQPDLSWMAGEWISCKDREVGEEHWLGPNAEGQLVAASLTRKADGRSQWEFQRVARTPEGASYFASPSGHPPTEFKKDEQGPPRSEYANPALPNTRRRDRPPPGRDRARASRLRTPRPGPAGAHGGGLAGLRPRGAPTPARGPGPETPGPDPQSDRRPAERARGGSGPGPGHAGGGAGLAQTSRRPGPDARSAGAGAAGQGRCSADGRSHRTDQGDRHVCYQT